MIVFLLLAASVAAAPPAETETARKAALGRAVVEKNCAACHATGPVGASPNPRAPLFRELGERYPVENLAEALAEGIYVGHPEMPQFILGDQDAENIVLYLKSLQHPPKPPPR
ncbi:MAG: c-type cytochrome [Caulobacteraceae bacterium]